jgi:hypothetical protein
MDGERHHAVTSRGAWVRHPADGRRRSVGVLP